jgi:hypothetical protein
MAVRGQAATELVLGLLVMVTVILFGIQFAEVSILAMKVQEASASALWDSTAQRHFDMTSGRPNDQRGYGGAGGNAATRYGDFDGRQIATGQVPKLVFTTGTPIAVNCQGEADPNVLLMLPSVAPYLQFTSAMQGGIRCRADSEFSVLPTFTRRFLQNAPFKAAHITRLVYPICSMGRGASCNDVPMMLGDWGFTDQGEENDCELTGPAGICQNPGYYNMVKDGWRTGAAPRGQPGYQLARRTFWRAPRVMPQMFETSFFMAAVGETHSPPFQHAFNGEHGEAAYGPYTVSPGSTAGCTGGYCDPNVPALANYGDAWANWRQPFAFGFPQDLRGWPAYQPP